MSSKPNTMEKVSSYYLSVFLYSLDSAEPGGKPTTIFLRADGLTGIGYDCIGNAESVKLD